MFPRFLIQQLALIGRRLPLNQKKHLTRDFRLRDLGVGRAVAVGALPRINLPKDPDIVAGGTVAVHHAHESACRGVQHTRTKSNKKEGHKVTQTQIGRNGAVGDPLISLLILMRPPVLLFLGYRMIVRNLNIPSKHLNRSQVTNATHNLCRAKHNQRAPHSKD